MVGVRRLLIAAGAVIALGLGALLALGRVVGVGPLAEGAPGSWLYVLIARGGDELTAREVEAIDLATGQRRIFDVGGRAMEIALSADRRTLFAGSERGTVFELDATRGSPLIPLQLSVNADVQRIVPTPDGKRLAAILYAGTEGTVSVTDLATARERGAISIGRSLVGGATLRGDVLLVGTGDRNGADSLVEIGLDPPNVIRQSPLATARRNVLQTAGPALTQSSNGKLVALSPFSLRLLELEGTQAKREVDLSAIFPRGIFASGFDGEVALAADGSVAHICLGSATRGVRLRASLGEQPAADRISEVCGRLLRLADGTVALAIRGKPELHLLDPVTGEVRRILALAGIPVRLAN